MDKASVDSFKVIISTNAAESSITIPELDHIIDCGLLKTTTYDEEHHSSRLELSWISEASEKQRAGRTGRERAGNVYRLYPRAVYSQFGEHPEPDIKCEPASGTLLLLRLTTSSTKVSLAQMVYRMMDKPTDANLMHSIQMLEKRRLLDSSNPNTAQLTEMGKAVATLCPQQPEIGVMLWAAQRLGVLPQAIW